MELHRDFIQGARKYEPQSRSDGTVVEKTNTYKYLSSASTLLGSTHSVCLIEGARAGDMNINIHQIKSERKKCK